MRLVHIFEMRDGKISKEIVFDMRHPCNCCNQPVYSVESRALTHLESIGGRKALSFPWELRMLLRPGRLCKGILRQQSHSFRFSVHAT